jgi:hypothetical protein
MHKNREKTFIKNENDNRATMPKKCPDGAFSLNYETRVAEM